MLAGMDTSTESYFDRTRCASLADAQAEVARTLGLDVLIADLARLGITLKEYRRVLPQAAAPGSRAFIEGGRRD